MGQPLSKHWLSVWVTLMPHVSSRDCLPEYRIPFPSGFGLHGGSVLHAFRTWEGERDRECVQASRLLHFAMGWAPRPGQQPGKLCCAPAQTPSLGTFSPADVPEQRAEQAPASSLHRKESFTEMTTAVCYHAQRLLLKFTCFVWAGSKCCLLTGHESHGFMSSFHTELVLTNQW